MSEAKSTLDDQAVRKVCEQLWPGITLPADLKIKRLEEDVVDARSAELLTNPIFNSGYDIVVGRDSNNNSHFIVNQKYLIWSAK